MSNYLSRIAIRNMPGRVTAMVPATPVMAMNDPDPFQQNSDDQPIYNSSPQDEQLHNHVNEPAQHSSETPRQNGLNENIESRPENKIPGIKYITKHIERLAYKEIKVQQPPFSANNLFTNLNDQSLDKLPAKNQHALTIENTVNPIMELPVNKKEEGEQKITLTAIEPGLTEPSSLSLKQKQLIRPSYHQQIIKNIHPVVEAPKVTRLNPVQPPTVPTNTRNNDAAPKLVIGKIIVEVVQPVKPAPVKPVNRVVYTPAAAGSSKTNKLSFGLGQL